METKQATVLPSGWEAQALDTLILLPLTQYHTPGEKVTVIPVFQQKGKSLKEWTTCGRLTDEDIDHLATNHIQVRRVFEVVSEEESKACGHINKFIGINGMYAKCKDCGVLLKPVDGSWELLSSEDKASVYVIPEDNMKIYKPSAINLSVEEAAEKTYNKLSPAEQKIVDSPEWKAGQKFLTDCDVVDEDDRFMRFYDFIAGWNKCANHIIQSGEYVKLSDVIELMENRIIRLQEMKLSKLESETLINENEYMLMKITTLKNKQ